jgi:hypothetical protein
MAFARDVPMPLTDLALIYSEKGTDEVLERLEAIRAKKAFCQCSSPKKYHECSECVQQQIYRFLFCLIAKQFQDQPRPKVLSVGDEQSIGVDQVDKAISELQSAWPLLLKDTMDVVLDHKDGRNLVYDFKQDSLLLKVINEFQLISHLYEEGAKFYGIPLQIFLQHVLPTIISLQAISYIKENQNELILRYPSIEAMLFSAKKILNPRALQERIRFKDDIFFNEASRIAAPESKFSKLTKLCRFSPPRDNDDVARLFENTIFNRYHPINDIVVTAPDQKLEVGMQKVWDLENYFLFAVGHQAYYGGRDIAKPMHSLNAKFEVTVAWTDYSLQTKNGADSFASLLLVKSLITKEVRALTVLFFKESAENTLALKNPLDLKRFYDVCIRSKDTPIAMQPASHNAKKSGALIFAMIVFHYFKGASNDATLDGMADVLQYVLRNIRSYNPDLIASDEEYNEALKLAFNMCDYNFRVCGSEFKIAGLSKENQTGSVILPSLRNALGVPPALGVRSTSTTSSLSASGFISPPSSATSRAGAGFSSVVDNISKGGVTPRPSPIVTDSTESGARLCPVSVPRLIKATPPPSPIGPISTPPARSPSVVGAPLLFSPFKKNQMGSSSKAGELTASSHARVSQTRDGSCFAAPQAPLTPRGQPPSFFSVQERTLSVAERVSLSAGGAGAKMRVTPVTPSLISVTYAGSPRFDPPQKVPMTVAKGSISRPT